MKLTTVQKLAMALMLAAYIGSFAFSMNEDYERATSNQEISRG